MKPQEPKRPFPYEEREVSFVSRHDSFRLNGTLTYPKAGSKHPAIVLVSGSGPQDRDEEIVGHKPFLVLSDYLTRAGIAVLRYDDRHYRMPVGKAWKYTSHDFAGDAQGAVDYLKTCEAIDSDFIGICGHSEGGLIAAMVAADRNDLGCIISLAGPGQPGSEIGRYQAKAFSKDDKEYSFALKMIEIACSPVNIEDRKKAGKALIRSHFKWHEFKKRWQANAFLPLTISEWNRTFHSIIPSEFWSRVSCPVLALCGEYDRQVLPEPNLALIRDSLVKSGNKDFEVHVIPRVNHLFQTLQACDAKGYESLLKEYQQSAETMSPKVMELIADFILKRAKPVSV